MHPYQSTVFAVEHDLARATGLRTVVEWPTKLGRATGLRTVTECPTKLFKPKHRETVEMLRQTYNLDEEPHFRPEIFFPAHRWASGGWAESQPKLSTRRMDEEGNFGQDPRVFATFMHRARAGYEGKGR